MMKHDGREDSETGCDNKGSDNEECEDREEDTNQLELNQGEGRKVSGGLFYGFQNLTVRLQHPR